MEYSMSFYESLSVTTKINAATTYTALGGSIMCPEVLTAMQEASRSFVSIHELQLKAGAKIAKMTRNDAAYITSGGAAGIVLSVLALRTHGDLAAIGRIIENTAPESEVIMHVGHRIPYDPAVRLAGSRIVTIGNALQTFDWELESAINSKTTAILYVAGTHMAGPVLPLETVIRIAHSHDVPVLVDAAAQLPPHSNLWHYTQDLGADLVIFSGGKALRGPQASGLILGKEKWIEAVRANGAPFQRLARALKVGKEEIAGLTTAIDRYMTRDHAAELQEWNRILDYWWSELKSFSRVVLTREDTNEAGQPVPRIQIFFPDDSALRVVETLRDGTPSIEVVHDSKNRIWIGADCLQDGEELAVIESLKEVLISYQR
jgi:uncharacterized pyridoxal phosphate-dependent enzyme